MTDHSQLLMYTSKSLPPRFACTECRQRKVKCQVQEGLTSCIRCVARKALCSYAENASITGAHQIPEALSSEPTNQRLICPTEQVADEPYSLIDPKCGLDIGHGSPGDILREGELTSSLLWLFFDNFNDIQFMFDQQRFMRMYALGDAPKMVLFAMMALGIKYSKAPFKENLPRSHRGETLYKHARSLLQEEFDHPSISTAQAYVLLCMHHLTFGGSRKAWIYLNNAHTIAVSLKLCGNDSEGSSNLVQESYGLIASIAFVDWLLSPSIGMQCAVQPSEAVLSVLSDDNRRSSFGYGCLPYEERSPALVARLLQLADLQRELISSVRQGRRDNNQTLESMREWSANLPDSMRFSTTNLEAYQHSVRLRQFVFMHIMYHHGQQILYFESLSANVTFDENRSICYDHASKLMDMLDWAEDNLGITLHNAFVGQCLTISAVIQTHNLLTASTVAEVGACQARIRRVRARLSDFAKHCRIFSMISAQLESFLKICSLSSSPIVFNDNRNLLNQMLHLGTSFERLDYETAGRLNGLETLVTRDSNAYVAYIDANPDTLLSSDFVPLNMHSQTLITEPRQAEHLSFHDLAWVFRHSSQLDKYQL